MQMALESGQLDRVSEMLGTPMGLDVKDADDTIRKEVRRSQDDNITDAPGGKNSTEDSREDNGSNNNGNDGPKFFDDFFGEEESC
mmetsp:Transcript_24591/g.36095  ORF Transcript_24591/g.36095 Transcript_24591/m.36095 type:complete len:85 (+) Transcript_24591:239-493(+)